MNRLMTAKHHAAFESCFTRSALVHTRHNAALCDPCRAIQPLATAGAEGVQVSGDSCRAPASQPAAAASQSAACPALEPGAWAPLGSLTSASSQTDDNLGPAASPGRSGYSGLGAFDRRAHQDSRHNPWANPSYQPGLNGAASGPPAGGYSPRAEASPRLYNRSMSAGNQQSRHFPFTPSGLAPSGRSDRDDRMIDPPPAADIQLSHVNIREDAYHDNDTAGSSHLSEGGESRSLS